MNNKMVIFHPVIPVKKDLSRLLTKEDTCWNINIRKMFIVTVSIYEGV